MSKKNPEDPHAFLLQAFESLALPKTHATVGLANWIYSQKQLRTLLTHRRLPDNGWSDIEIQSLLFFLSTLDTNTKTLSADDASGSDRWCGVGEREGRVYSSLVQQRHYGLSHGMGRSGDIAEPQPKAVGSSLMVKLTLALALDAMRRGSGLDKKTAAAYGIVLPLCTGMSMSLVLSSLRTLLPNKEEDFSKKTIVLWSRIDQKSCFKAVASAGLDCVVVPTKMNVTKGAGFDDEVLTDEVAMEEALKKYEGRILAVITTTSCFAPRVPDKVDVVGKLCEQYDVFHVINNAYGLQCPKTCKLINRACTLGRVDAIVCSTDKNFLVPVGGAIISSPKKAVVESVGKVYAGRASSTPILDLFITLLSMGLPGYQRVLQNRQKLLATFPKRLEEVAQKHGERLLQCPSNTISFGITLDALIPVPSPESKYDVEYWKKAGKEVSALGAMLFTRCVSGTRVVPRGQNKMMGEQEFVGFGSSYDKFPHAYMTAACAIGLNEAEMNEFFNRLDKTLAEYKKKQAKKVTQAMDKK